MSGRLVAALACVLALAIPVAAADELKTLATRPGVSTSFLLVRPAGEPRASVILFAGGNGALHLGAGGMALGGNFLVRNRARFAAHDLLVAVVDAPSDHPNSLDRFRASAEHAADVRAVIAA
ncbi:MAG TPA: alpha/beta hydrolase, partial [Methylomirabilota bacterium]|nr:alpha/beta hydrolase [Methylomirabilota bacterium]